MRVEVSRWRWLDGFGFHLSEEILLELMLQCLSQVRWKDVRETGTKAQMNKPTDMQRRKEYSH